MISVLLLNLEQLRSRNLLSALNGLNAKGQVGLGALAGLSLAFSLTNEAGDTSLTDKLMTHTQRFQNHLAEMSDESVGKLSSFLNDAMNIIAAPSVR
jgi:hypothetical protein